MNIVFYILYTLLTIFTIAYTWTHIDLNFTFFNHELWNVFRSFIMQFTYYHRAESLLAFLSLIAIYSYISYISHKKLLKYFWFIVGCNSLLALLSYNFLSHDLFNYIFDAKILTYYHQNPYLMRPLDFPSDGMLTFMHWIHRTYPYGPTFLFISLLPSFLSVGKLFIAFFTFKILWIIMYIYTSYFLYKYNKASAVFFATQPLIIFEGLINVHNDFLAVCIAIIGIILSGRFGTLLELIGGLIKYITLPSLLLKSNKYAFISVLSVSLGIIYLIFVRNNGDIFPWYFLNLFIFLPSYPIFVKRLTPLFTLSLLSYMQYIRYGTWWWSVNLEQFALHNLIQYVCAIISLIVLYVYYVQDKQNNKKFLR